MAILKVLTAPNPILNDVARPVREDEFGYELETLMHSMLDTMYAENGVGLAAPQIGDSRRILVAEPKLPDIETSDFFMMVNPVITKRSDEIIGFNEGCLSVPDFLFAVPRHKVITVEWFLPDGTKRKETLRDYSSIVIQHEIDHLDGITLLNRASRPHRRKYLRDIRKKKRKNK